MVTLPILEAGLLCTTHTVSRNKSGPLDRMLSGCKLWDGSSRADSQVNF